MKNPGDRISVRLPSQLMKLILADAKTERRLLSDYIRLALQDHVAASMKARKEKTT
jgi:hypothetical protein